MNWDTLDHIVGWSAENLTWYQMGVRAFLAFVMLIALIRTGNKRLLGKGTAFDNVISIMIGSVMAQSIHDSGPFFRVWFAVAVLILTHALFSRLAKDFDFFGPLIKGHRVRLIRDGEQLRDNMQDSAITEDELKAQLRSEGEQPELDRIKDAWLERDGSISILTESDAPKVLDVQVQDGVQTVRIQVG